jgi:hypothetical protein
MSAADYAYARPGGAALIAAGITSVGRYLGTDSRCITPAELQDYHDHDVSVWFIKENNSQGMLKGWAQGLVDATNSQNALNALGQPNAAVYFAVDFDVQANQFQYLDTYLRSVATIIPVSRIGIYAGIAYLNHAETLASFYWKTASSSFDHGQTANMPLHLIQTTDGTPIANTDYDEIIQSYYGQTATTTTAADGGTVIIPTVRRNNKMIIYNTGTGFYLTENGHSVEIVDATIKGQQITQALSVDVMQRIIYQNPEGKLTVNVEEASIFQYWVGLLN